MEPASSMSKYNGGPKGNTASTKSLELCAKLKEDKKTWGRVGRQVGEEAAGSPVMKDAENRRAETAQNACYSCKTARSALDISKVCSTIELGEVPRGAMC